MSTNLITQSGQDELGLNLNDLDGSLSAHADGSLSAAHGINLFHFTAATYDAYANDVRYYQDSNGDVVGEYQLRFSIGGVVYYAPARASVLAAQDPVVTPTAEEVAALIATRGSSALATDFDATLATTVEVVRDSVLLPHSRLGHWEAHAPLRVYPRVTLDSAGHTVGRYIIVCQFRGAKFEIPCDTRLGGPPQPLRWTGLGLATNKAFTHNAVHVGNDNSQTAYFFYRDDQGTAPRTVTLQVCPSAKVADPDWTDIPEEGATITGGPVYDSNLTITAYSVPAFPVSLYTFTIRAEAGHDDSRLVAGVRVKTVGVDGVTSYTLPCHFYANDEDGCGFISGPDSNSFTNYE